MWGYLIFSRTIDVQVMNTKFFANLCEVQLKTDCSATFETRIIFPKGAVQQLIEELGLTFAPSVQQSRTCSIPLSNVAGLLHAKNTGR